MTSFIYQLDPYSMEFPSPNLALDDPNGLLAVGGDLSPARLLSAYRNGIFPWFNEDEPPYWWSPSPRAVLFLNELHISKSFAKFLRKQSLTVSINNCFSEVIENCAVLRQQEGTWITDEMMEAYTQLHHMGHAHSIEVWQDDELVGGLYGVLVGGCFCGESMFHKVTNASKLALVGLVNWLQHYGGTLIDCQIPNDHLLSLGVSTITREDYLEQLRCASLVRLPQEAFIAQQIHY